MRTGTPGTPRETRGAGNPGKGDLRGRTGKSGGRGDSGRTLPLPNFSTWPHEGSNNEEQPRQSRVNSCCCLKGIFDPSVPGEGWGVWLDDLLLHLGQRTPSSSAAEEKLCQAAGKGGCRCLLLVSEPSPAAPQRKKKKEKKSHLRISRFKGKGSRIPHQMPQQAKLCLYGNTSPRRLLHAKPWIIREFQGGN